MYHKECAYCGESFETPNKRPKYCSHKCRKAVLRERSAKNRAKNPDAARKATKKWADANKAKSLAYRESRKARTAEISRKHYQANKERKKAQSIANKLAERPYTYRTDFPDGRYYIGSTERTTNHRIHGHWTSRGVVHRHADSLGMTKADLTLTVIAEYDTRDEAYVAELVLLSTHFLDPLCLNKRNGR